MECTGSTRYHVVSEDKCQIKPPSYPFALILSVTFLNILTTFTDRLKAVLCWPRKGQEWTADFYCHNGELLPICWLLEKWRLKITADLEFSHDTSEFRKCLRVRKIRNRPKPNGGTSLWWSWCPLSFLLLFLRCGPPLLFTPLWLWGSLTDPNSYGPPSLGPNNCRESQERVSKTSMIFIHMFVYPHLYRMHWGSTCKAIGIDQRFS